MDLITHNDLVQIGAKYFYKYGSVKWNKPRYVVTEIVSTIGQSPDIFCFGSCCTQQIEVKVSRADFLADLKKPHRINKDRDVGIYRSYLCPNGVIKVDELPDKWGLYYYIDGKIKRIKDAEAQEANTHFETLIISSIMRRLGIKSQIFNFKNK